MTENPTTKGNRVTEDEQTKSDASEALFQSRENSKQIDKLAHSVGVFVDALNKRMDYQDTKLDTITNKIATVKESSTPNLATMAAWAGVLITLFLFVDNRNKETANEKFNNVERAMERKQSADDQYRRLQESSQNQVWQQFIQSNQRTENRLDDLDLDTTQRLRDRWDEKPRRRQRGN